MALPVTALFTQDSKENAYFFAALVEQNTATLQVSDNAAKRPGNCEALAKLPGVGVELQDESQPRQQAEGQGWEREEEMYDFLDNAPVAVHLVSADGVILYANRAQLQLLGYTHEEYVGRHSADFHVDESTSSELLRRSATGETLQDYEVRLRCKDGVMKDVLVNANARWQGGRFLHTHCFTRDVTARKRMENAMRESEERFALAVRGIDDGLWDWNISTDEVYYAPRFKALLGYDEQEFPHSFSSFESHLHPDDHDRTLHLLQEHLANKRPFVVEYRLHTKDGEYRWFHARGQAVWNEAGYPTRMAGSIRDITNEKRIEAVLRENEERFESLFIASPIGIFQNNADGQCVFTNPRWQAITGLTREESLGDKWTTAIAVEDREAVLREWQSCVRASREFSSEFRLVRPTGEVCWVHARSAAIRSPVGEIRGYVGTTEDITDRRHSEEALVKQTTLLRENEARLQAVFSSVVDGIITIDDHGDIQSWNPAAERIFGYATMEVVGQNVLMLMPEPYRTEYGGYLQRYREGGQAKIIGIGREVTGRRKDGSDFPMELGVSEMHAGGQRLFIGTVRDISERHEIERMKEEFISVVSHELRTPLTSIRGSLGLMAGGKLGTFTDKGQRMLDIAVTNTDRLIRLINDILDIERIQSGKVTMERQECDAAALMTLAVESVRAVTEKADVTVSVTPLPVMLWADPDRIVQTLVNLLGNAAKFSPAGAMIGLSATAQGEEILFQVTDQGRGIPSDKLENIFERFQQVDASDARQKGGSGLGLAICRSIVRQHGGRIWVESRLGQGSTFFFTIPSRQTKHADLGVTPPDSTAMQTDANSVEETTALPSPKTRVLIVEDDGDLAQVLAATLERYGAAISIANTGNDAIAQCQHASPTLLVLDPGLPDRDGFAVVEALRLDARLRHIPTLVYSAREFDAVEQQRLTLGPTQFFTKSRISPQEFAQRVMPWLDKIDSDSRS